MADFQCFWRDERIERGLATIKAYSHEGAALKYVEDMDWEAPKPMSESCDNLRIYVREHGSDETQVFDVGAYATIDWSAERVHEDEESEGDDSE